MVDYCVLVMSHTVLPLKQGLTMKLQETIPPGLAAIAQGRDTLPTNEAAKVINRKSQSLRKWASQENGPIRPIRIFGRLAWKVSDLALLLNGSYGMQSSHKNKPSGGNLTAHSTTHFKQDAKSKKATGQPSDKSPSITTADSSTSKGGASW